MPGKENERPGAIIAFMDIKSAAKARSVDNQLDGVPLVTEYSEPGATSGARTTTPTTTNDANKTTPASQGRPQG